MNLLDLNLDDMQDFIAKCGEPRYRAQQLIQWIYQRGVSDFSEMSNLSLSFRHKLSETAEITCPDIVYRRASKDGTIKWLFRLHDGNAIETVYIPERTRGTLCISSQVGCALNCSFCSTGKEGFNRNLSVAEIIGQIYAAKQFLESQPTPQKITNVVMMGMGEPLLNYDAVVKAMSLMMSDYAFGLSKYRVTLSTSGVIPEMNKLKQDSEAALAVSLHAANDPLRTQLVPINKKYPLKMLMQTCKNYFENQPKRKVTFEYVMLAGVNDSLADAKQLAKLVQNIPCKMNLIPFNPFAGSEYRTSPAKQISAFQDFLTNKGVDTWVRKTRGDDIDAACGQLAGKFLDRTGRNRRWLKQTEQVVPLEAFVGTDPS